ncbi:unnamed protein product [Effrenium voratum]|nr:unnamed protein product [Effrenium voratum]
MVFSAGEAADRSFLPQSGHFQYMRLQRSSSPVDKTFWIAEMCLWTPWSYTGDLVSGDFSRLAVLDAKGFRECVAAVPQMQSQAHFYAQGYVDALNEEQDKSDVWFFGIVGQASLLSRPSASPSFAAAAAGASAVAKAVGDGAQTLKVRCCCRRRSRKKKSKKPKAVVPTP